LTKPSISGSLSSSPGVVGVKLVVEGVVTTLAIVTELIVGSASLDKVVSEVVVKELGIFKLTIFEIFSLIFSLEVDVGIG